MNGEDYDAGEAELGVFVDEAYELLRLKLAEREAREEVELLDDLMLLQSVQLRVAQRKPMEMTMIEMVRGCMLRMRWAAELFFRRSATTKVVTTRVDMVRSVGLK